MRGLAGILLRLAIVMLVALPVLILIYRFVPVPSGWRSSKRRAEQR
jgi:hypothetical protein